MARLKFKSNLHEMIVITLPDGRRMAIAPVKVSKYGNKIDFVVEAPKDVIVDREIVHNRRQANKAKAEKNLQNMKSKDAKAGN